MIMVGVTSGGEGACGCFVGVADDWVLVTGGCLLLPDVWA